MFFDNWQDILRTVLAAVAIYVAIVFLLRVSGKRTLSKMNSFDFVVTIALGSLMASSILSEEVSISEGIAGAGALILMQYLVTWLSVRWPFFQSVIKADPTLLYYRGQFMDKAMKHKRITKEEVYAIVRAQGFMGMDGVEAIVFETQGDISVVGKADNVEQPTLKYVENFDEEMRPV